jgi:hypothetical protein
MTTAWYGMERELTNNDFDMPELLCCDAVA